jgi:hypothetical protein
VTFDGFSKIFPVKEFGEILDKSAYETKTCTCVVLFKRAIETTE